MLILFDLDKTLIDRDYQYTCPGLPDAVARATARGHMIGLNSDTPIAALFRFRDELGMNGPVVGERGAVLWINGETFPTGTAPPGSFRTLRDRVIHDLTWDGAIEAILGDPTSIIRTQAFITCAPRRVVLASALRQFSVHFAARGIDGRHYQHDHGLLSAIEQSVREHAVSLLDGTDLDWDVNPEYGILILHTRASVKRAGVEALLERMETTSAVMVGDSAFDNVQLPGVRQWAVGNAAESYKAACERVAHAPYTAGAIELLDGFP